MRQTGSLEKRSLKKFYLPLVMIVYLLGFFYFYYRYVPLIKPFQLALAPLLAGLFILTSAKREWGTLIFVFLFPLINNWPYFFGIDENIPHAPTALILFLAYFGGFLASTIFRPFPFRLSDRIWKPLAAFTLLVLASGLITFLRYTNFFPFLTGGVYEVIVNVNHVRAGGALMSVLFNSLSYITGFLLFFLLLNLGVSPRFARRLFVLLSFSTLISLAFAFVQRYGAPGLGNTSYWVRLHQLNSTFKDPNSFGLFLCALTPVFLGLVLSGSRRSRIFYALLLLAALFILPAVGARIAFLALLLSLFVFLLLSLLSSSWSLKRKTWISLTLVFFSILTVLSFSLVSRKNVLSQRLTWSFSQLSKGENPAAIFTLRLNLWKAAALMVEDYPLTGVGVGGYIIELPNYLKLKNLPFRKTDSAENYFLQIGAELGLAGLLLFFWLIVEIIRQMKSRWRLLRRHSPIPYVLIGTITGILAIFVNYLFHSFIGGFEAKYLFWTLLAILFVPETEAELPSPDKRRTVLPSSLSLSISGFPCTACLCPAGRPNSAGPATLASTSRKKTARITPSAGPGEPPDWKSKIWGRSWSSLSGRPIRISRRVQSGWPSSGRTNGFEKRGKSASFSSGTTTG
jgi:O-antigen ligase